VRAAGADVAGGWWVRRRLLVAGLMVDQEDGEAEEIRLVRVCVWCVWMWVESGGGCCWWREKESERRAGLRAGRRSGPECPLRIIITLLSEKSCRQRAAVASRAQAYAQAYTQTSRRLAAFGLPACLPACLQSLLFVCLAYDRPANFCLHVCLIIPLCADADAAC
jgi:hypothetical protein